MKYYSLDEEDFAHLYKFDEETNESFYMDHCWTGEGIWCKVDSLNYKHLIEISPQRAYIIENALDINNTYLVKRKGISMIHTVSLLCIVDKKILCVKYNGNDTFCLPHGYKEENETDIQALIRITKEQLSVDIKENTINFYGTFEAQVDGEINTNIRKRCYIALFDGDPTSNNEIVYLNTNNIDKVSSVDKLVFDNLKELKIIE